MLPANLHLLPKRSPKPRFLCLTSGEGRGGPRGAQHRLTQLGGGSVSDLPATWHGSRSSCRGTSTAPRGLSRGRGGAPGCGAPLPPPSCQAGSLVIADPATQLTRPTPRGPHGTHTAWTTRLLLEPPLPAWPCPLAQLLPGQVEPCVFWDPCMFPPFGLHMQCCPGGARSVQRQHAQVWEERCRPKTLGFLKKQ